MRVTKIKTAHMEGKTKPIFRKIMARNMNEKIKITKNNLNEAQKNEPVNHHTLQNSLASLDNSLAFNELYKNTEEYDNYMLNKKYLLSKTQYNKKIAEIADIDEKLTNNNNLLKILENNLEKIIKEKKEKQLYVVELLSKKESLEEIYNIKIASLISKKKKDSNIKNNNNQQKENKNKNKNNTINEQSDNSNDNNNSENNEMNAKVEDENIIEIKLDDIKASDKKIFAEQIINFTELILQKKDMEITNKINEKINMGYNIFFSEISSPSEHDTKKIIDDFFLRISVFITNQSKGIFSENLINIFLKQLLKINSINVEIADILKYLNKTYKNNKKELKDKINNLNKKNENLKNKKISYENIKNELKKFIDENSDKIKNNENIERQHRQYMSFILDSHIDDEFDFLNESKNHEATIIKDDRSIFEYDNDNNKIKDISKRLMLNKALRNPNNYQTIVNRTNNNVRKHSQIFPNLNNFIIQYMPWDNRDKKLEETINTKSTKEIKVKNLLINNNINIENNNIIKNTNEENKDQQNISDIKSPRKLISYCISKKNVRRPNINGAYNPFDNSYMTELDMSVQLYKDLVRDLPNTFCYFKLPDKNNFAFNPLNSTRNNPLKYNYYEGYLLIDNKCDKIKIARKSEEKYIVIFLKDIMNIHLSRQMINIIKIHNSYLKNGAEDIEDFIKFYELKLERPVDAGGGITPFSSPLLIVMKRK